MWQRPINILAFIKKRTYGNKNTISARYFVLNFLNWPFQNKLCHFGFLRVCLKAPLGQLRCGLGQMLPIAPPRTRCVLWDHMASHPLWSL